MADLDDTVSMADATSDEATEGGAVRAVPAQPALTVTFGLDAAGRWKVAVDGPPADDGDRRAEHGLDLAGYPTDDPDGAVRLRQDLRGAYPDAEVRWLPGVMDSLDELRATALRLMETAAADRLAALEAAEKAARSRDAAVAAARAAGITPTEIARETGWARSSL
ncbi:hypothetical protein [Pseudofrankia sp. BMG5.37]|uniref:hypothetical protein n=1 Tax=Pseudofrankia sp. BMG5.37 TaxID=3050035 RepID=UPI0028954D62|nr:hypothetical protein [Pseudofrankia sp. BMG5.37]MDT3443835.1 hypothetical protein [Pseudofrankia sp. BMG5.37]